MINQFVLCSEEIIAHYNGKCDSSFAITSKYFINTFWIFFIYNKVEDPDIVYLCTLYQIAIIAVIKFHEHISNMTHFFILV